MSKKTKIFTALSLVVTMITSSFNGMVVVNAAENELENDFGYTMYATSYEEGAITLSASNICINGDLMTNGTVEYAGNMNHNGEKVMSENEPYHFIYNKVNDNCFFGNYEKFEKDTYINETNLNLNNSMLVYGGLTLVGNVNINSYVQSMGEMNISGNTLNANNTLIMSKYNDINISSENISITGLIYAPLGEVNINANNCNLNNVIIIANKINIQCSNLNANYNSNYGKIIGNESEIIDCAKEDWKYIKDTDGDGLNDYYETYYTFTDITLIDTDENEILDCDEDNDYDGLSNVQELHYYTHPLDDDTDNDDLSDGDEVIVYGSNPLIGDTDKDGLFDGDEVYLETDIFVIDTDENGITDDKEMFNQIFIYTDDDYAIERVFVEMECTGNINKTTTIEDMLGVDVISSSVVGLIGSPYEITTESYFEEAKISFKLSEEYLQKNNIENFLILWYDETNSEFVPMDTKYDVDNGCLSTVTTHFSQYMIVDSDKWFKAWMKEIDYYSKGENKSITNNTVIVMDCSGSMDTYDHISSENKEKNCYRIEAADNYISKMGLFDWISIITFSWEANVLVSMSDNSNELKAALQSMYDYGGTDFNAALKKAIGEFGNEQIYADETNNRIIFMSDGIATCSPAYLAEAKSKGIVIHTVGLGESSGDVVLKNMADTTGGTFMKAVTADELVEIFIEFGLGEMDTTDTDGDGLYDVIEASGIRLENGTVITTQPLNPDSDNDGLLDGEEIDPTPLCIPMNIVQLIKSKYNGTDYSEIGEYYFRMISDPNNPDTDGDGYSDVDELNIHYTNPNRSDVEEIELDNDYIKIKYEGTEGNYGWNVGEISYGSSQMWFFDEKSDSVISLNFILEESGCGLISIADIIFYLSENKEKYETFETDIVKGASNIYDYDSYMDYLYRMYLYFPVKLGSGILGTSLSARANIYFAYNEYDLSSKWCVDKDLILHRIEKMLNSNIPVTFSVGPSLNGDCVNLYYKYDDIYESVDKIDSHYMTVTGVYKDNISDEIWLRVSSWGREYYIDYNEYLTYIDGGIGRSVTSNILYIEDK